jgi:uncharacterized protein (DUF952 family)
MALIYHLVPPTEWEQALEKGSYHPASLASEGFIHFSTRAQLIQSATRFFAGEQVLVVLEIPERRLQAQLKYEAAGDGDLFPHYYQALDIEMVEDTRMLHRNAQGEWTWD